MLYCRNKIYPLGLPNGISHVLTALALLARLVLRAKTSFLPPATRPLEVSVLKARKLSGRFSLLAVTTLHKFLLTGEIKTVDNGRLRMLAIEDRPLSMLRAMFASVVGRLGRSSLSGVHFAEADEISIEGESSSVILDGETFHAEIGRPIVLRTARPLSFVRLAA